jgi:hypothetical protein
MYVLLFSIFACRSDQALVTSLDTGDPSCDDVGTTGWADSEDETEVASTGDTSDYFVEGVDLDGDGRTDGENDPVTSVPPDLYIHSSVISCSGPIMTGSWFYQDEEMGSQTMDVAFDLDTVVDQLGDLWYRTSFANGLYLVTFLDASDEACVTAGEAFSGDALAYNDESLCFDVVDGDVSAADPTHCAILTTSH